ncbi:Pro-interleukin-16 [Nymphon striatum]|nr:Pro-interleukin-16 [Nymphon striatum]
MLKQVTLGLDENNVRLVFVEKNDDKTIDDMTSVTTQFHSQRPSTVRHGTRVHRKGVFNFRQPPDGHEFPPIYSDRMSNTSPQAHPKKLAYAYVTEFVSPQKETGLKKAKSPPVPPKPMGAPPPLPKGPPPLNRPPKSAPSIVGCVTKDKAVTPNQINGCEENKFQKNVVTRWPECDQVNRDERVKWKSEDNLLNSQKCKEHVPVSVKDRIAMFSSQAQDQNSSPKSSPPKISFKQQHTSHRKQYPKDNTNVPTEVKETYQRVSANQAVYEAPSMEKSQSVENLSSSRPKIEARNMDNSSFVEFSESLVSADADSTKPTIQRRESFNGYTSSYPKSQLACYRYPGTLSRGLSAPHGSNEATRMSNILESRRDRASKLKGLIIPDRPGSGNFGQKTLPTIVRGDSVLLQTVHEKYTSAENLTQKEPKFIKTDTNTYNSYLKDPLWHDKSMKDIPKYSPAFKRRSLQLAPSIQNSNVSYPTTPLTQISSTNTVLAKDFCKISMATSKPVEQIYPEKPSPISSVDTKKPNSVDRPSEYSRLNQRDRQAVERISKKTMPINSPVSIVCSDSSQQSTHFPKTNSDIERYSDENRSRSNEEVKALNRLNNLLDQQAMNTTVSDGVKEAVNGFLRGALDGNLVHETMNSPKLSQNLNSAKYNVHNEVANDSCFEEEEDLTSKSSSPAPSFQSDDLINYDDSGVCGKSSDLRSRYACRTDSSDSALKSFSSDQKSFSTTDDSWSDASSDSIDRPIDPELRPRKLSQQRTVLKEHADETDSVKNFRALAQTWQQRAGTNMKTYGSNDNVLGKIVYPYHSSTMNGFDKIDKNAPFNYINNSTIDSNHQHVERRDITSYEVENTKCMDNSHSPKTWMKPSKSLDCLQNIEKINSRSAYEHSDTFQPSPTRKYSFESKMDHNGFDKISLESTNSGMPPMPNHKRLSSIGSSISESDYDYTSPITSPSDVYGSVSSLASTGSLISAQEMQQLLDEASHSLEESGTVDHQVFIVVLHKEAYKSSTGITLSGGSDYEQKEIIVHKVIKGSLADKDGRVKKGDRILSINGRTLRNMTHRESMVLLKSPRSEITLVVSRPKSDEIKISHGNHGKNHDYQMNKKAAEIEVFKDGPSLGFSIEGGKDSPFGDRPLRIKRIFNGGAADKGGSLNVGDEILSINAESTLNMTRLEAWKFMKNLSDGAIRLTIKKNS